MKKEHFIAYKKGITRSPSDYACSDGELAACINLTVTNEEVRTIRQPKEIGTLPGKLMYVHLTNDAKKNYIYVGADALYFRQDLSATSGTKITANLTLSDILQIESIGNTLIVGTKEGLEYILWKNGQYIDLGNSIPEPDLKFKLAKDSKECEFINYAELPSSDFAIEISKNAGSSSLKYVINFNIKNQQTYTDTVVGLYDLNYQDACKAKAFTKPFLICYALKLYDGNYSYISQPILMYPSVHANTYAISNGTFNPAHLIMNTFGYQLYYKMGTGYESWKDIVKGITVFISDPIEIYDTTESRQPARLITSDKKIDGIYANQRTAPGIYRQETLNYTLSDAGNDSAKLMFNCLSYRSESDVIQDISERRVFYKLFDAGTDSMTSFESASPKFRETVLANITTQEQLDKIDYYSRCPMISSKMFMYNQRLNLYQISRGFYAGYHFFSSNENSSDASTAVTYNYLIRVYIRTNRDKDTIVEEMFSSSEKLGYWFYYPDTRAYKAEIYQQSNGKYYLLNTLTLKEHDGTNGAYYIYSSLPNGTYPWTLSGTTWSETDSDNTPEILFNKIIQSEVNNPFIFNADGYNTVGKGNIIGISTNTVALSQGQFGQHPLLVFTTEGIWAIPVTSTGTYEPAQPMSREVCSNPESIIQTDGAVYFVSKKGLMMIYGTAVKYLTPQMEGKIFEPDELPVVGTEGTESATNYGALLKSGKESMTFINYLQNCVEAYDYAERKMYLLKTGSKYFYIYDLENGSVSQGIFGDPNTPIQISQVVNDYPDSLIQDTSNNIYTLYYKDPDEDVTTLQSGILLTRPLKLIPGNIVKTIADIHHVGNWSAGSEVKMKLFMSNDLKNWYDAGSKMGASAIYFRIALYVKLLPTDRITGTLLIEDQRRASGQIRF